MRFIQPYLRDALFKDAVGNNWIGRVQAVSLERECVPMLIDGVKYMLEFSLPVNWLVTGNFEQMQRTRSDGGIFLPTLEHRRITFTGDIDSPDPDGAKQICFMNQFFNDADSMATMLQQAFIAYLRTHPQVAQYFYESDVQFSTFLQEKVLNSARSYLPSLSLTMLSEIAAPQYGFAVEREAGDYYG